MRNIIICLFIILPRFHDARKTPTKAIHLPSSFLLQDPSDGDGYPLMPIGGFVKKINFSALPIEANSSSKDSVMTVNKLEQNRSPTGPDVHNYRTRIPALTRSTSSFAGRRAIGARLTVARRNNGNTNTTVSPKTNNEEEPRDAKTPKKKEKDTRSEKTTSRPSPHHISTTMTAIWRGRARTSQI